jgi:hypothetical protein
LVVVRGLNEPGAFHVGADERAALDCAARRDARNSVDEEVLLAHLDLIALGT